MGPRGVCAPLLQLPFHLSGYRTAPVYCLSQGWVVSGLGSVCLSPSTPPRLALLQTQAVRSAHCQDSTHTLGKGTSDNGIRGQTPVLLLERSGEGYQSTVRSRRGSVFLAPLLRLLWGESGHPKICLFFGHE